MSRRGIWRATLLGVAALVAAGPAGLACRGGRGSGGPPGEVAPGGSAAGAPVHDAASPFAKLPYVVMIAVLLWVGCWPKPILRIIDASARPLLERTTPTNSRQYAGPPESTQ